MTDHRPAARNRLARLAAIALGALVLAQPAGCSPTDAPTAVPTTSATDTPRPTSTPSATETPRPTPTEETSALIVLHTNDNYGETKECG